MKGNKHMEFFTPNAIKEYMQDNIYQADMYSDYDCCDDDGVLNSDIDFEKMSQNVLENAAHDDAFWNAYYDLLDNEIDRYMANDYKK